MRKLLAVAVAGAAAVTLFAAAPADAARTPCPVWAARRGVCTLPPAPTTTVAPPVPTTSAPPTTADLEGAGGGFGPLCTMSGGECR